MRAYFLRRLLLIPLTLLGLSIVLYTVFQFVPGGPIEQMRMAARQMESGKSSGNAQALSEEQIEAYKELFGFDKPPVQGYLTWLGVLPRETNKKRIEFAESDKDKKARLPKTRQRVVITRNPDGASFSLKDEAGKAVPDWEVAYERKVRKTKDAEGKEGEVVKVNAVLHQVEFSGVLQGSLGESIRYNEPVASVIVRRLPVSLWFGLWTLLITYLVSIPLGVAKALKHKSAFDTASSGLIFLGYAIPAYAVAAVSVVFIAGRAGLFPMSGFHSIQFEDKDLWGKFKDLWHHTALPLMCYIAADFAFLTMMMKNQLMETLSADYIRTAVAKGLPFKKAVFRHAFRNSFVPIATHLGHFVAIFVTGSFLIETIFDIDGVALLGFSSLIDRDYPVVMGVALMSALFLMIGNILADLFVAWVDPRISYK